MEYYRITTGCWYEANARTLVVAAENELEAIEKAMNDESIINIDSFGITVEMIEPWEVTIVFSSLDKDNNNNKWEVKVKATNREDACRAAIRELKGYNTWTDIVSININ